MKNSKLLVFLISLSLLNLGMGSAPPKKETYKLIKSKDKNYEILEANYSQFTYFVRDKKTNALFWIEQRAWDYKKRAYVDRRNFDCVYKDGLDRECVKERNLVEAILGELKPRLGNDN